MWCSPRQPIDGVHCLRSSEGPGAASPLQASEWSFTPLWVCLAVHNAKSKRGCLLLGAWTLAGRRGLTCACVKVLTKATKAGALLPGLTRLCPQGQRGSWHRVCCERSALPSHLSTKRAVLCDFLVFFFFWCVVRYGFSQALEGNSTPTVLSSHHYFVRS